MLSHLPNLEELSIKKDVPEQPYKVLKEVVEAGVPVPKLTYLSVNWTWADEDRSVALLVSLFLGLRRFWTLRLGEEAREMLWRGGVMIWKRFTVIAWGLAVLMRGEGAGEMKSTR